MRLLGVSALALAAAGAMFGTALPAQGDLATDSRFTFARLHYSGGGDWYSDASSLVNLMRELNNRTTVRAAPKETTVTLKTNDIFNYPIVWASGHGNITFNPEEAERLRKYLTTGGFIWFDDDYGLDEYLRPELRKLLPDKKLVELPPNHEIFNCFYKLAGGIPKIHEHHGGPGHAYAMFHEGRMILFYSYNTDIGDGLEDPEVHHDPPEKREEAMRMAINVVIYVLTH